MLIPVGIKDPSSAAEILKPSKCKIQICFSYIAHHISAKVTIIFQIEAHCFHHKISNNNTDTNIIANVIKFITLGFIKIPKKK